MNALQDLEVRHPEWRGWLSVVRTLLPELAESRWDSVVPSPGGMAQAPLLAGASIQADERAVLALLEKLRRAAVRGEVPKLLEWNTALSSERGAMAVFEAALHADEGGLVRLAADAGVEPEAFAAAAALLPMPFLHACARAWVRTLPPGWSEGYCPCCGAWPAFAEVCGIERSRYLRCLRCASAWESALLRCPYCGNADHERLGSLRVEDGKGVQTLDVCGACRGYVKVFNRLSLTPAADLMPADLASVDLDVAAATRDYRRPPGAGFRLAARAQPS